VNGRIASEARADRLAAAGRPSVHAEGTRRGRTDLGRRTARLLLAAVAAVGAACGTVGQRVGIVSEPAGAEVYVDGKLVGKAPLMLRMDRGTDHLVFVKLEGYVPERAILALNQAPDDVDFLTPADVNVRLQPRLGAPTVVDPETGEPVPGTGDQRNVRIEAELPKGLEPESSAPPGEPPAPAPLPQGLSPQRGEPAGEPPADVPGPSEAPEAEAEAEEQAR
jgi:hypothetical protein